MLVEALEDKAARLLVFGFLQLFVQDVLLSLRMRDQHAHDFPEYPIAFGGQL